MKDTWQIVTITDNLSFIEMVPIDVNQDLHVIVFTAGLYLNITSSSRR
jgi:hypothetical protein